MNNLIKVFNLDNENTLNCFKEIMDNMNDIKKINLSKIKDNINIINNINLVLTILYSLYLVYYYNYSIKLFE
jgi:hypothetical protein